MSRRFGRNQKRKMREQVANAILMLEETRASRKRMKELLDEVSQELDDAKRIAGEMSVLFKPKPVRMNSVREYVEVVAHTHMLSMDSIETIQAIKSMRLPVLLSSIEQDMLKEMVHVRVHYDGGALGYAVTQQTMRSVPKDILLRRVGSEIAHQLIETVMGNRK